MTPLNLDNLSFSSCVMSTNLESLSVADKEKKRFLVISGETSAEYGAIDELENGLKKISVVVPKSVKVLHARPPVDGIRAFAIGLELKDE